MDAGPNLRRVSYLCILQEVNEKARKQVDEAREEITREFGAVAASEPVDVAGAALPRWRRGRKSTPR